MSKSGVNRGNHAKKVFPSIIIQCLRFIVDYSLDTQCTCDKKEQTRNRHRIPAGITNPIRFFSGLSGRDGIQSPPLRNFCEGEIVLCEEQFYYNLIPSCSRMLLIFKTEWLKRTDMQCAKSSRKYKKILIGTNNPAKPFTLVVRQLVGYCSLPDENGFSPLWPFVPDGEEWQT